MLVRFSDFISLRPPIAFILFKKILNVNIILMIILHQNSFSLQETNYNVQKISYLHNTFDNIA